MRIEKLNHKVVCDLLGCGKLADYSIVTDGGERIDICHDCAVKLKKAFKELKIDE